MTNCVSFYSKEEIGMFFAERFRDVVRDVGFQSMTLMYADILKVREVFEETGESYLIHKQKSEA
ncbi:hypothetical protein OUZ56_027141 [Daphnia magna]|uniref:Uncharacterized protein n=1 Tax=Daphnia magna TaxID=35525 RepID=A0ABQ9ZNW2_9CRUS|nr:hypothetical protein OUZ56_027141 [Daphnia magna]